MKLTAVVLLVMLALQLVALTVQPVQASGDSGGATADCSLAYEETYTAWLDYLQSGRQGDSPARPSSDDPCLTERLEAQIAALEATTGTTDPGAEPDPPTQPAVERPQSPFTPFQRPPAVPSSSPPTPRPAAPSAPTANYLAAAQASCNRAEDLLREHVNAARPVLDSAVSTWEDLVSVPNGWFNAYERATQTNNQRQQAALLAQLVYGSSVAPEARAAARNNLDRFAAGMGRDVCGPLPSLVTEGALAALDNCLREQNERRRVAIAEFADAYAADIRVVNFSDLSPILQWTRQPRVAPTRCSVS